MVGETLVGWFEDPVGRFDGRFFDGVTWTNQVSQDGKMCIDPNWVAREQVTVSNDSSAGNEPVGNDAAADGPAPYEPSKSGERRQINLKVDVDRRRQADPEQASATSELAPYVAPESQAPTNGRSAMSVTSGTSQDLVRS